MDRTTIGALVWTLSTRWRTETDRTLAPLGLTQAQYACLVTLSGLQRKAAPTQRDLARRMGMTAIYVSKLLRALAAAGLVSRTADAADARAIRLTLTAEGAARLTEARLRIAALEQRLTAPLGEPGSSAAQAFRISLRALLAQTRPADSPPPEG